MENNGVKKIWKRHFTKEGIRMTSEHIKEGLTSLIMKAQSKTSLKYHYTPKTVAKQNKTKQNT